MKQFINKWGYSFMSVIGLASFVVIIILLANGNRTNREEILKSRIINLQGRAQVINEIDRVCKK